MFDYLYEEAYDKLTDDIRQLVNKLVSDNAVKPRDYRDGLDAACYAVLNAVAKSRATLIIAYTREEEKQAAYYESRSKYL